MIPRILMNHIKNSPKSVLLLGPRQTGKSTLMRQLNVDLNINLMKESTYLEFAANPNRLEELMAGTKPSSVLIDEIQRLPSLLNTIQTLIDESDTPAKFYMTGSSARKLKRGAANLLPGRLFTYRMGPLSAGELNYQIDNGSLAYGTLPEVQFMQSSALKEKLLTSYTGTYLKEEIQAEALTKNIEGFARFLFVIAAGATRYLDLSKLAQQAQIDRSSAVRWFEILEDTLLIYRIEMFAKSSRKRLVQHPRFFMFDNGVLNALLKNFSPSQDRIGMLFENLFCSQLFASAYANDKEITVSSFRTSHGAEVDFIVEIGQDIFAIECKSTTIQPKFSVAGFSSFAEVVGKPFRKIVAYLGKEIMQKDDVEILPWQDALKVMGI